MGRDIVQHTSLPLQHARWSGVSHFESLVFTLAPLSISASTIHASPLKAAACNGLRFSLSWKFTSSFCPSNSWTSSTSPVKTALIRGGWNTLHGGCNRLVKSWATDYTTIYVVQVKYELIWSTKTVVCTFTEYLYCPIQAILQLLPLPTIAGSPCFRTFLRCLTERFPYYRH